MIKNVIVRWVKIQAAHPRWPEVGFEEVRVYQGSMARGIQFLLSLIH